MYSRISLLAFTVVLATSAFGQAIPGSPADAFQVRYASNLNVGDSVVNITNAGTANTAAGAQPGRGELSLRYRKAACSGSGM